MSASYNPIGVPRRANSATMKSAPLRRFYVYGKDRKRIGDSANESLSPTPSFGRIGAARAYEQFRDGDNRHGHEFIIGQARCRDGRKPSPLEHNEHGRAHDLRHGDADVRG